MLWTNFRLIFVIFVLISLNACALSEQFEKNAPMLKDNGVEGIGGGTPYLLSAQDVILILDASGFSPEEVLQFGPDLRRHILTSGAAIIKVNGVARVAISIIDGKAYLSRRDGSSAAISLISG